jgi:hypothetical protein
MPLDPQVFIPLQTRKWNYEVTYLIKYCKYMEIKLQRADMKQKKNMSLGKTELEL